MSRRWWEIRQFIYNGEIYEGKHKPVITQDEFDTVQFLLAKKGKPRPKKHEFAYTGLLTCGECGSGVTAEIKSKFVKSEGKLKHYRYYRCTKKKRYTVCGQRPIRIENLESQIEPTVSTLSIMPEFKNWALEILKKDNEFELNRRSKIQKGLQKRITEVEKELYDLNKTYTRGKLDDDFYEQEKKSLKHSIKQLKKDLLDSENAADQQIKLAENRFRFACNARERFATGDVWVRREILSALSAKFELTDGKLLFTPHKWIQKISDSYPELERQLQVARTTQYENSYLESMAFRQIYEIWGE